MKSFAAIAGALLLAGCASLTARGSDPVFAGRSAAGLDATAGCLVTELDRAMASRFALEPSITHKIVLIQPGKVVEVSPQQEITIGAEVYFARVTATGPRSASVEFFANAAWSDRVIGAVKRCAGVP